MSLLSILFIPFLSLCLSLSYHATFVETEIAKLNKYREKGKTNIPLPFTIHQLFLFLYLLILILFFVFFISFFFFLPFASLGWLSYTSLPRSTVFIFLLQRCETVAYSKSAVKNNADILFRICGSFSLWYFPELNKQQKKKKTTKGMAGKTVTLT